MRVRRIPTRAPTAARREAAITPGLTAPGRIREAWRLLRAPMRAQRAATWDRWAGPPTADTNRLIRRRRRADTARPIRGTRWAVQRPPWRHPTRTERQLLRSLGIPTARWARKSPQPPTARLCRTVRRPVRDVTRALRAIRPGVRRLRVSTRTPPRLQREMRGSTREETPTPRAARHGTPVRSEPLPREQAWPRRQPAKATRRIRQRQARMARPRASIHRPATAAQPLAAIRRQPPPLRTAATRIRPHSEACWAVGPPAKAVLPHRVNNPLPLVAGLCTKNKHSDG
jgi:hypothetical protein